MAIQHRHPCKIAGGHKAVNDYMLHRDDRWGIYWDRQHHRLYSAAFPAAIEDREVSRPLEAVNINVTYGSVMTYMVMHFYDWGLVRGEGI